MVRIVGEIGEKLLELGQHVADQTQQQVLKGTAQSAKSQILGQTPKKTDAASQDSQQPEPLGQEHFKHMLGDLKQMSRQEIETAKLKDVKGAVTQADQVRANLQAEIMSRKRSIDQQIQEVRVQKRHEIPKYVAGKPREARTQEEKVDLWQKQQKEAEKKKKEEDLAAAVKQFQGSKEVGKFAVG